jgi:hypothetical protein
VGLMPRIPVRIQTGPFGTSTGVANGRSVPMPSVRMGGGAAQMRERFESFKGLPEGLARALNRLQDSIALAVSLVKRVPFLDGNLVQGVKFTSLAVTQVNHGLGRQPQGYEVKNIQGAGSTFFWSRSANEAQLIFLVSSDTCTGDVWVY